MRSRRRRRAGTPNRLGVATIGALTAALAAGAIFLPWYAPDVSPPFAADSVSGWESTNLARLALVAAVAATAPAVAIALDERGVLRLDARAADALAWVVTGAAAIALALILYRLVMLPAPAEFLSRRIGVYLATVAAAGALLSGLALLATRD